MESLLRRIAELEQENQWLRQELDRTREQLAEARREIARFRELMEGMQREALRQAAPFRRAEKAKVPPADRKRPGRKPGHPGARRVVPERVDEEIDVPLEACPKCSGPVDVGSPLEQYIEELPPVRPYVVKLRTWSGCCRTCGEVHSTHPLQTSLAGGAAKVQLGPRALAVAAGLSQSGLSMRKVCRVLKDLAGLTLSPGGLAQALQRVAGKVQGKYEDLKAALRVRPAVFADETSWWVNGPGWWLWTFTTPNETVYVVDQSRGSDVVREILTDGYSGVLVSDCLSTYDPATCRKHKCIAHHQQAISKAMALPGQKDRTWLTRWKGFFHAVIALHKVRAEIPLKVFTGSRAALERTCDALLASCPMGPGDVSVRNRLQKQRAHLLTCLYEPAAEPTNNRAERALRPAVIARKISCGNKTDKGRACWQTLASLATTARQQARNFIDDLAPQLALAPAAG